MKYAVAVAALLACSCREPSGPSPVEAARTAARTHSTRAYGALDLVGRRIEEFFARRHPKIESLTEELFSLKGKWRAVFWGREDFERHVRRRFEEHVFRPEDFEREVLAPVRADLAFAMESSEAGLAADLNRWARARTSEVPMTDVRLALSSAVTGFVLKDLGLNLATLAGSEVAALTASIVLTRVGVLGGSIAAGAGSSWATFGIGLVVGTVAGLIIDAVVGDVLEEAARETIRFELDNLRTRLMESRDGLYHEARRVLETHAAALERSAAVLAGGSGESAS